jgi:hypothetical protein
MMTEERNSNISKAHFSVNPDPVSRSGMEKYSDPGSGTSMIIFSIA